MLEYYFIGSIKEVDEQAFDVLSQQANPFMQYGFYLNLESSGCLGDESGWIAYYLIGKENDQLKLFVPLFLKSHSYGEFVFDFTWAQAYEKNGLEYYPKLVNATPFTPAMGVKQLIDVSLDANKVKQELKRVLMQFCDENKFSSCHVLFDVGSHQLTDENFMLRQDVHFIWFNDSYQSFDDLLATFKSRKRKNVNKERKAVKEQGITFEIKEGLEITANDMEVFYGFYQRQHAKYSRFRSNTGYLNQTFFKQLLTMQPDNLVMVCAQLDGKTVGVALSFKDDHTLYGRYWGCSEEHDFLHFETCYYQGIEYCIKNNLKTFDPGVQGEHKLNRGFVPHKTYSTHYFSHPQFKQAISGFLKEEKQQSDLYFEQKLTEVVYKKVETVK
ncbi:MAG: GNAT family N-acetyltransferase [Saccharospirillaceae bacterium]|nr:GNAT family N-acetyltransferase [Pseudomonadales bacterium]NRB79024.1 GNAT family N-acetyltransferase [Saccharospirillaceae bacterium]